MCHAAYFREATKNSSNYGLATLRNVSGSQDQLFGKRLVNSDGVLRICPWPRGSLWTHFQVLGLGLVIFSMTHRCTDTATKKVLMILAKTVTSVSSFPSCRDVTTLVVCFCHKSGVPARALWHDVPP